MYKFSVFFPPDLDLIKTCKINTSKKKEHCEGTAGVFKWKSRVIESSKGKDGNKISTEESCSKKLKVPYHESIHMTNVFHQWSVSLTCQRTP